jgi:hypothetical protein
MTEPVEGYCVKERKTVRIKVPRRITTADGRTAIVGVCPDCGIGIFKAAPGD